MNPVEPKHNLEVTPNGLLAVRPTKDVPEPQPVGNDLADFNEHNFVTIYKTYYPELLRYAERFVDQASAPDAVQEAFLRLWRRKAEVDPRQSVRALLYRIVRNLTLNQKRNEQRHERLAGEVPPPLPPVHPETALSARLLSEHLDTWIQELPPRRREAFELSRFHGLTYSEIAAVMEVTPSTIENHIVLALKFLRRRLHAYDTSLLQP